MPSEVRRRPQAAAAPQDAGAAPAATRVEAPAASGEHGHSHGGQPCSHNHGHSHSHGDAAGGHGAMPPAVSALQELILSLSNPWVLLLFAIRVGGAIFVPIADCDEVYNYWEPLHYLLYGSGMQTWEYSPDFALRSYGYLRAVSMAATTPMLLGVHKRLVFYSIRVALALFATYAELFFSQAVGHRFGRSAGGLVFWSLLASYGMCAATSAALLPNSAAMIAGLIIFGCWLRGFRRAALLASGFVVVAISPFVAVVFVPMALHVLVVDGPLAAVRAAGEVAAFVLVPCAVVDWWYFGKPVVSAWNIVEYNALASEERGAELYGVEPWSYYAVNLALNFNIVALVGIPMYALLSSFKLKMAECFVLAGGLLWLALMAARPHKEERFLFPVYPLIALYFALSVEWILDGVQAVTGSRRVRAFFRVLALVGIAGAAVVSVSRGLGQVTYFGGAVSAYSYLARVEIPASLASATLLPFRAANDGARGGAPEHAAALAELERRAAPGINVCVGKEWYRFPSSFFLPQLPATQATAADGVDAAAVAPRVRLQFVPSGFGGQLPQHFPEGPEGRNTYTSVSQPGFNDRNKEDPARYVDLKTQCHYLLDFDLSERHQGGVLVHGRSDDPDARMQAALRKGGWETVFEAAFMNSGKTQLPARAFLVPPQLGHVHYDVYRVWRNEALFADNGAQ